MAEKQITKTTYLGLSDDQRGEPSGPFDPFLLVINGVNAGAQLPIPNGSSVIGRLDGDAQISLDDDAVSHRHAQLERDEDRVQAIDLDSTNGLFINEQRTQQVELTRGDVLTVGRTLLKFVNRHNLEAEELISLLRRATTDDFTGICNKKHFIARLTSELSRAGRHEFPLSVVMFDVDHFKRFNDTYGHLAGDAVLVSLARTVSQVMRQQDLLARFGGEEFVVMAPEIDLEEAHRLAQRVRAAVAGQPVEYEGLQLGVRVSLGCSTYTPDSEPPVSATELIGRADKRMYLAKSSGRDTVR
ncbi:MAG: GGDEF domain-containing protein [Candidatus Alcyoniella australis]|nr:GGDEF domain-containing protein [Candidatus Alcyoniella australis]